MCILYWVGMCENLLDLDGTVHPKIGWMPHVAVQWNSSPCQPNHKFLSKNMLNGWFIWGSIIYHIQHVKIWLKTYMGNSYAPWHINLGWQPGAQTWCCRSGVAGIFVLWKWRVRRVPSLCYFHVKRPFLRNHLLCLFLPLLAHGKSAFSPPSEISDGGSLWIFIGLFFWNVMTFHGMWWHIDTKFDVWEFLVF